MRTRCVPRLRRESFSVARLPGAGDGLARHAHPAAALLALDGDAHHGEPRWSSTFTVAERSRALADSDATCGERAAVLRRRGLGRAVVVPSATPSPSASAGPVGVGVEGVDVSGTGQPRFAPGPVGRRRCPVALRHAVASMSGSQASPSRRRRRRAWLGLDAAGAVVGGAVGDAVAVVVGVRQPSGRLVVGRRPGRRPRHRPSRRRRCRSSAGPSSARRPRRRPGGAAGHRRRRDSWSRQRRVERCISFSSCGVKARVRLRARARPPPPRAAPPSRCRACSVRIGGELVAAAERDRDRGRRSTRPARTRRRVVAVVGERRPAVVGASVAPTQTTFGSGVSQGYVGVVSLSSP